MTLQGSGRGRRSGCAPQPPAPSVPQESPSGGTPRPERYYVTESSGFTITPGSWGATGGSHAPVVEVLVLDRDYCHRVVWTSLHAGMVWYRRRLPALHAEAHALAEQWNAEDAADAA